jgi:hypothetical protein
MKLRKQIQTTMSLAAAMGTLGLLAAPLQAASIATTGFNYDWILASSETYATENAAESPPVDHMWYAADSGVSTTTYPGWDSTGAQTVDGKDFQLQSYTANNVLYKGTTYGTNGGDLTLVTPGSFSEISVLGGDFNTGTGGTSMTINFGDASDSGVIAIDFPAWAAATSGAGDFDAGITANGTTSAFDGTVGIVTYDLAANGFDGKTVESITFTSDADGYGVFGLSGVAVPEPSTTALLGLGGFALILRRRK